LTEKLPMAMTMMGDIQLHANELLGEFVPALPRVYLRKRDLLRLSPEHGEVIDLVYYHGKSVREVAEIVGVAEATVKTRMFYARRRLAS